MHFFIFEQSACIAWRKCQGCLKLRPFKAGVGVSSGLVEEKGAEVALYGTIPLFWKPVMPSHQYFYFQCAVLCRASKC